MAGREKRAHPSRWEPRLSFPRKHLAQCIIRAAVRSMRTQRPRARAALEADWRGELRHHQGMPAHVHAVVQLSNARPGRNLGKHPGAVTITQSTRDRTRVRSCAAHSGLLRVKIGANLIDPGTRNNDMRSRPSSGLATSNLRLRLVGAATVTSKYPVRPVAM